MTQNKCPYCKELEIIKEENSAFCTHCGRSFIIFDNTGEGLFFLEQINEPNNEYFNLVYETLNIKEELKLDRLIEKGMLFLKNAPEKIRNLLQKEFRAELFDKYLAEKPLFYNTYDLKFNKKDYKVVKIKNITNYYMSAKLENNETATAPIQNFFTKQML